MSDQFRNDDVQALWQSQSPGDAAISLEEIRTQARRLEERVARRNRREYIAAAIVVAGYGPLVWFGPTTTLRLAGGLVIAATVFVVHRLHVHGTAAALPADLALSSALEYHRAQLLRQRNLLRSVWLWFLMPFAPGLVAFLVGLSRANPERSPRIVAGGMVTVIIMFGLHLLNRRVAARIQRRLDRLSELQ